MNILVTGGAGYIGSHLVKMLGESGDHRITVLDNLSTGHREAVLCGDFEKVDLADFTAVENVFAGGEFDAVIHFAASIVVPESVGDPLKYYMNNTVNTANLVKMCRAYGVDRFVFSSTAAVYGQPDREMVRESTTVDPISPYGMSKLMSERIIRDTAAADDGFNAVILRYFNIAGADPDGRIGQSFPDATHLIKVACQTALGMRDELKIFGTDYPTEDGTGVRDYIHVTDLAAAHVAALHYLCDGGETDIFNCGYGHGFSVRDVIRAVKSVSGVDFPVVETDRRPGDPASLIADSGKTSTILGWRPQYDDLDLICRTALEWERSGGY